MARTSRSHGYVDRVECRLFLFVAVAQDSSQLVVAVVKTGETNSFTCCSPTISFG